MKKIFLIIIFLNFTKIFSQSTESLLNYPGSEKIIGTRFPIEQFKKETSKKTEEVWLNNKPTLINFWFTTCEPCIEEMPILNQLHEDLKNKINFIGATFSSKDKVENFLTKHHFSFDQITDVDYKIFGKNKITRFPTTFILDKKGNIQYVIGKVDSEKSEMIKKILLEY